MEESLKYFLERTTPFGSLARFQKQRLLKKKFRQWEKDGGVAPMPNFLKGVAEDCIQRFPSGIYIDT